jgi:hypothetical protein
MFNSLVFKKINFMKYVFACFYTCSFVICSCIQCSKWAGIPKLLFVPEFHTGTYQYIVLPYIHLSFYFSDCRPIPCFAFNKYVGCSKFPRRVLSVSERELIMMIMSMG